MKRGPKTLDIEFSKKIEQAAMLKVGVDKGAPEQGVEIIQVEEQDPDERPESLRGMSTGDIDLYFLDGGGTSKEKRWYNSRHGPGSPFFGLRTEHSYLKV